MLLIPNATVAAVTKRRGKKRRYALHAYHEKFFSQVHGAVVAKFKKITTTSYSNLTLI